MRSGQSRRQGVCEQGVLFAMRGQLTSAEYWRSSDRGSAASSFLQLLACLIPRQPLLHSQVPLDKEILET